MTMLPPTCKNELLSFLGIVNYLGKFSPMTAKACDPLSKLRLVKMDRAWNVICYPVNL